MRQNPTNDNYYTVNIQLDVLTFEFSPSKGTSENSGPTSVQDTAIVRKGVTKRVKFVRYEKKRKTFYNM